MAWIETIPFAEASGRLKKLYDRVKGPGDRVDNIMMAHSLRPHTMEGHMSLYKNVLHHTSNSVAKWRLELIGVWVSLLNGCSYCVEHHFRGLCRALKDEGRGEAMRKALEKRDFSYFSAPERALLAYAEKLTITPASVREADIDAMRDAGFSDGEVLEANQVVAYFGYANRTVLGLGVSAKGDILGLSPRDSDNSRDWNHG